MTIKELEQKYNYFRKVNAFMKINGKKAEIKAMYIKDIKVVLTSGYESSFCSITAEDVSSRYRNGKLEMDSDLEALFVIGGKLEIFLGYHDDKTTSHVFTGYITSVSFELGSNNRVTYSVEAMDLKVFMMNSYRSELKKDIKKYSDAVANVLNDYISLYESKKIDSTDDITALIEQHNQSDYDFVVDIAKRLNYLFFVVKGKVSFIKYSSANEEALTVNPSIHLKSFMREVSISNQIKSVIVRSYDEANIETPIEETVSTPETVGGGSKVASDLSKLISEKQSVLVIDNAIKSQAEAKARATAELTRQTLSLSSGEMELVGIPDVFPATIVRIGEMGEKINGKYFITEVEHMLSENKFQTTCKFISSKVQ